MKDGGFHIFLNVFEKKKLREEGNSSKRMLENVAVLDVTLWYSRLGHPSY